MKNKVNTQTNGADGPHDEKILKTEAVGTVTLKGGRRRTGLLLDVEIAPSDFCQRFRKMV